MKLRASLVNVFCRRFMWFRVPSVWDEYKWYLIGIVLLILLQSATISGLLINSSRLKRAERQNRQLIHRLRALSERLRSAKVEEGIRIAREMQDELGGALTSLKWNREFRQSLVRRIKDGQGGGFMRSQI
jgi:glucose-6-phosphate-specific signal transduction histidine kinase